MSGAPGRSQRISELEHALANGFPSESAVVVQADDASGRLTIQVSWVRAPADARAREWRCAVDLRFDPDVITRHASPGYAERRSAWRSWRGAQGRRSVTPVRRNARACRVDSRAAGPARDADDNGLSFLHDRVARGHRGPMSRSSSMRRNSASQRSRSACSSGESASSRSCLPLSGSRFATAMS